MVVRDSNVDRARVFGERLEAVERIAPGFFPQSLEAEHMARYRWASRWVRGRIVLDVACGTGYGAQILNGAGAKQTLSVDVSRDALQYGSFRFGISGVCSDAQSLPLASGCIEVVVSLETIEHLKEPFLFARELWRVLRGGGELLLSTPNVIHSPGPNPYHVREFSLEELRILLEDSGFRLKRVWGQHWGLSANPWWRVKGLRRALWEIERRPAVTVLRPPRTAPRYWCVRAERK